jgi:15-cis-phytoene synthase
MNARWTFGADACSSTDLTRSYARCAELNRQHGTTYYWSTMVLPKETRPHVHALYGFCRYADDIVDDPDDDSPMAARAVALAGEHGIAAVVDTVQRFAIDPECFRRFLRSMTMDLTIVSYDTWADLLGYMDGSAAVIGEMMLPLLEPLLSVAIGPARDLGNAFQLTNFLRDVGEDLERGRVYLPQEDLRRFDVDPAAERERLGQAPGGAACPVSDEWQALMRFEIERCRALYRSADVGVALLPARAGRCISSARVMYARILDRIEAQHYDVFRQRARVPTWRKLALVGGTMLRRG